MGERLFGGPRDGQGDFGKLQGHMRDQSRMEGQKDVPLKGGHVLREIESALAGSGLDEKQRESLRTALLEAYYTWEAREEKSDSSEAPPSIH